MARRTPSPRMVLSLLVLALCALALLPTRLSGWVGWFRGPTMTVLAPISGPMSGLSGWLRPGERRDRPEEPEAELLGEQLRELEQLHLRALDRIVELEQLVSDLQRGVLFEPPTPIVRRQAQRVGADLGSGLVDVSLGSRRGVSPGTVAIARGSEQLVGVVTRIGPMTSTVHLITDRRIQPALMECVVMPQRAPGAAEELAGLPRMQLTPGRGGMLVADEVSAEAASAMEVGRQVRLLDDTWSDAARLLVLGRIVRIENLEDPLFKRVVVQPEVEPARLRSVILAIPQPIGVSEEAAP